MIELLRPAAEWELQSMIANCAERKQKTEVIGYGALSAMGRPTHADVVLSTSALRGVTLYEPMELVMSARSGTLLKDIEAELATRGQMLPFEPIDLRPCIGEAESELSIGGVFATNMSGARRVTAGSARDHLLGIHAVTGRAELFKAGGRVMKNVTGLDLGRALTGSWGTLAILTEVTFKVVPKPETTATLVYENLPDDLAIEALTVAMGTPFEVSGAMHLHARAAAKLSHSELAGAGVPVTLLRLENFAGAVAERVAKIVDALKVYGTPKVLESETSEHLWREMRRLPMVSHSPGTVLWRISTRPTFGAEIVAAVRKFFDVTAVYDWSGGLIWLELPVAADAGAADIRRAVAIRGGHATLIRADAQIRSTIDVFEPMRPEIERLSQGLKMSFDPAHILNKGRMYAGL